MRRRRDEQAESASDVGESPAPESVDVRADGPWDSAEKDVGDDPAYLDFGSLLVRGRPGFNLQVPTDDDQGTIGSVVLVTEDSGLELRAFADARSGGLWDVVRADLEEEAERLDGQAEKVDGPFGTERRIDVPVTLPDGEKGYQPTRIIGIEGPRWMLRATFLGQEALEPSDDSLLMQALRDVVVVRGDEPRPPRDPLLISIREALEPAEAPAGTEERIEAGPLAQRGVERPVLQAGMGGGLATSALAVAVSDAGGLGTIGLLPPDALRAEIAAVRVQTGKPLAVNLIVPF